MKFLQMLQFRPLDMQGGFMLVVKNVSKDLKDKRITLVEVQEEDQVNIRIVISCISLYP